MPMLLLENMVDSPINEPRAHLDGIDIPKSFVMPSLASVREEAVCSRDMRKHTDEYERIPIGFEPGNPANDENIPGHLKVALIFNVQFPNLFRFSYFVLEVDVPEDTLNDCIWALSLFIRIIEECSEEVLRAVGHVEPHNDYKISKYATLLNARAKITTHLLRAKRATEAIPYTKAAVRDEYSRGDESWLTNPMPFELYGETLVMTRTDDEEAVKMFRRARLGVESADWPACGFLMPVRTRTFLSRALRNMGANDDAEIHETWVIKWFRKNPTLMHDKGVRYLLHPPGPILEALGGEPWFETRKQTFRAIQRPTKACRVCNAREPLVTLLKCSNCQNIYYCSRECQRSHWRHHKAQCREWVATQQTIKSMHWTDPVGAKLAAWELWLKLNPDVTHSGTINALGLHKSPQRGRTHILIKKVEVVPTATKLKHKFRVVSCGVFLIKDVLRDVETLLNLGRGRGQEYIESVFEELDATIATTAGIPFIDLTFGDGIPANLGCDATSIDGIRATPYDSDWRKRFDAGTQPRSLKLESDARDVENVF